MKWEAHLSFQEKQSQNLLTLCYFLALALFKHKGNRATSLSSKSHEMLMNALIVYCPVLC